MTEPAEPPSDAVLPGSMRLLTVVIAALYVCPLFLGLPLTDPDEGLHAAIAREMLEHGEWVTPRFLGKPFLDKPILYFWAMEGSIAAFGAHEIAVRLPGTLFALAGIASTGLLGLVWFGRATACLAALAYATMFLPFGLAQVPVHDVALVPSVVLAMTAFWKADAATDRTSILAWSATAGVCLGLAMLTKGLTGVAFVGVAQALSLIVTRRLRPAIVAGGLLALVVAAATALPWYLAAERSNPGYLHYFFVERHLLGFSTTTQLHGDRPWWYYLPILVAGALPWSAYLPAAASIWWREWRTPWSGTATSERDAKTTAWVWLLSGVGLLSAAGSKLGTYLVPMLPAVALLSAHAIALALGRRSPPAHDLTTAENRSFRFGLAIHMASSLLIFPLGVVAIRYGTTANVWWGAWISFVLLVALTVVAGRPAVRGERWWFQRASALGAASLAFVMLALAPVAYQQLSTRELARYFNRQARIPGSVWLFDERLGSLAFYLEGGHRAALVSGRFENRTPDEVLNMRQPPADTFLVVSDRNLPRLTSRIALDASQGERAGRYRIYTADAIYAAIARTVGQ